MYAGHARWRHSVNLRTLTALRSGTKVTLTRDRRSGVLWYQRCYLASAAPCRKYHLSYRCRASKPYITVRRALRAESVSIASAWAGLPNRQNPSCGMSLAPGVAIRGPCGSARPSQDPRWSVLLDNRRTRCVITPFVYTPAMDDRSLSSSRSQPSSCDPARPFNGPIASACTTMETAVDV
jgi:hypothetical protein